MNIQRVHNSNLNCSTFMYIQRLHTSRLAADLDVGVGIVVSLDVAEDESIDILRWWLRYKKHSRSARL